jgi:hypothetical protein
LAEANGAPKNYWEDARRKEKKKKIKGDQNLYSDIMLIIRLYIESHIILYMRGL